MPLRPSLVVSARPAPSREEAVEEVIELHEWELPSAGGVTLVDATVPDFVTPPGHEPGLEETQADQPSLAVRPAAPAPPAAGPRVALPRRPEAGAPPVRPSTPPLPVPRPPVAQGRRAAAAVVVLSVALLFELWHLSRPRAQPVPSPSPKVVVLPSPKVVEHTLHVVPRLKPTAADPSPVPSGRAEPAPADTAPSRPSSPPPVPVASSPAPPTAPVEDPPAGQPASRLDVLIGQAREAMAARDYDRAMAAYREVEALVPGHAEARDGLARARGERAASNRVFKSHPTVRDSTVKPCDPWKGEKCAERRDLDCTLRYAIHPEAPVPGEPYTVEVTAVNTGRKDIAVRSLRAVLSADGEKAPQAVTPLAGEVARGEQAVIGRVEGVWKPGTTSWWLQATFTDQKGDHYRAQFEWELDVPGR